MKVTDEGSEDEIERVVQRHAPRLPSQTSWSPGTSVPEAPYEVIGLRLGRVV